jgi:ribosomal protein S15P/S13E
MLNLDEIKARLAAATPGPWRWYINKRSRDIRLEAEHSGRLIVMDFVRWGMQCAQPRFRTQPHDLMTEYSDCVPHADAGLIAHAPTDIAALIGEVEQLRETIAHYQADVANNYRLMALYQEQRDIWMQEACRGIDMGLDFEDLET